MMSPSTLVPFEFISGAGGAEVSVEGEDEGEEKSSSWKRDPAIAMKRKMLMAERITAVELA